MAAGVSAGAAAASAVAAAASATSSATSSAASAVSSANAEAAAEESASYARHFVADDIPPTETCNARLRCNGKFTVEEFGFFRHELDQSGNYYLSGNISGNHFHLSADGSITNDHFQVNDTGDMVVNTLQSGNITTNIINSTNNDFNINFSYPAGNSNINIGRNSTNSNPFSANSINIGTLNDPVYINGFLYNPFYYNTNFINQIP